MSEAAGRALSRVTLTVEVVHDGSPTALVDHLRAEAVDVLARWGCVPLGCSTAAEAVGAGDVESAARPGRWCAVGGPRSVPALVAVCDWPRRPSSCVRPAVHDVWARGALADDRRRVCDAHLPVAMALGYVLGRPPVDGR